MPPISLKGPKAVSYTHLLLYLPTVFLLYNYTALYQCGVLFLAALAGNALGALWGRPRKEETP